MRSPRQGEPATGGPRHLRGPGTEALRLIGYRSVRDLIAELARRSRRPSHIEREDLVARSTFHDHAPELLRIGAITRRVAAGPPRQVFYGPGPSRLELSELIDGWRALVSPTPTSRDEDPARRWRTPIGFSEAWAAGIVQALFDGPLSQPEIELIVGPSRSGLTPHRVRRLLVNNCEAGFFLRTGRPHGDGRYGLADLGRYAVGELAAGARFERRHMPMMATPITVEDVVGALRAHLPLLQPWEGMEGMEGICEFVIRADPDQSPEAAVAWVRIDGGRVIASGSGRPPQPARSWAQGTIEDWIAAVIDHRRRVVRASGESRLNQGIIDQLHSRIYRRHKSSPSGMRAEASEAR